MTRFSVAIAGAGIGEAHLEGYLANADLFDVRIICDLDRDRAEPLLERGNCEFSDSLQRTIARDDIDILDICLPPQLHKKAIIAALRAGKHVICEKPLVGSLADVDEIESAVVESDRQLMPVFQYRFGRGLGKLRRLIDCGLAGRPLVGTIETHWHRDKSYYDIPWRGKWSSELGGAIVGHAIHAHDLLLRVFGPAKQVQAMLATRVNSIEVEDCAAIIFTMDNGALVTSSVTLGSAIDQSRLRFCFSGLSAESGLEPYNPATDPWQFCPRESTQDEIDAALAAYPNHQEGFARQFELWHGALSAGGQPPVSLSAARASIELITAIYASSCTGCAVTLPLSGTAVGYSGWVPTRGQ